MTTTLKITNGDIVRSVSGSSYAMVEGKDKVRQDVQCILTTSIRPTTGLGCGLEEVIGHDTYNPISNYTTTPIMFEFQGRVRAGLDRLKRTQTSYQLSYRPYTELIYDYTSVQIWNINEDPRNFRWRVGINTVDGRYGFVATGTSRR